MNIIKTELYDVFRCVGGKCPYTCCAYWRIDIDENTDRFYQSCTGEFGELLNKYVVRDEDRVRMELINGHCAMLSPEGLCRIQLEYGEKALSRTCSQFPRRERHLGDSVLRYLKLSCPEVTRLLLKRDCSLLQSSGSISHDVFVRAFYTAANLIQDRELTISQRERLLCRMGWKLCDPLAENNARESDFTLSLYSDASQYRQLAVDVGTSPNLSGAIRLLRCFCNLVIPLQVFELCRLCAICAGYLSAENADFSGVSEHLRDFDSPEMQIECENLLIGLLFDRFWGNYARGNLYRQMVYLVAVERLYRLFYAVISTQNQQALSQNERVLLIVYISRFLEHADAEFLDKLDTTMAESGLADMAFITRLTS